MSVRRFYIFSAICGVVAAFAVFILGAPLLVVPGAFLAGMFGLPRWFVTFKRARRVKAFLERISQCARCHGARRQVRPAAAMTGSG
jgi:tight adherence protein B